MAKSNTLIVCGAGYVSGKEVMALELGRGLAESGRSVSFITSTWNNGDFVTRLKQSDLPGLQLPIGFISATLTKECVRMTAEQMSRWPGLALGYSRMLRRLRPKKIIHTNWHHLLLLFPFLRPGRDLFWVHECFADRPQYRALFRCLEPRLGCFVCVSAACARSLQGLAVSDSKIRVIHNGITDPSNVPLASPSKGTTFRIGIVGQVGAWKGHEDLIDAFALLHKQHTSVELHIFGETEPAYKMQLVKRAAEGGVAELIGWHDFVADRGGIYSELDICVVPSRSEDPFPTSAIEAGFFGKPTVATRRGGLPEIVENEVNGLLVAPESPAELADALCRLIDNPGLRTVLGANARRRAVDLFGKDRFLRDFIALLEDKSQKEPANVMETAVAAPHA